MAARAVPAMVARLRRCCMLPWCVGLVGLVGSVYNSIGGLGNRCRFIPKPAKDCYSLLRGLHGILLSRGILAHVLFHAFSFDHRRSPVTC